MDNERESSSLGRLDRFVDEEDFEFIHGETFSDSAIGDYTDSDFDDTEFSRRTKIQEEK